MRIITKNTICVNRCRYLRSNATPTVPNNTNNANGNDLDGLKLMEYGAIFPRLRELVEMSLPLLDKKLTGLGKTCKK